MNKYRHLVRIWNEVTTDNPTKTDEWHINVALEIYNNSYPNDPADRSDLMDALEHAGN